MGTVRYTTVNGKVIAEKRNGVRSRYISDALGSTVALLDNTQTKTNTFEYWPYGEVRTRTGTNPTPFQHVGTLGYYKDSASRTQVRARELDNQKGRWMTQDPAGFKSGDMNFYRYVRNSPVTLVDPSGLDPTYWPSDQENLKNCRKSSPGACFGCAYPIMRWAYGTDHQSDYIVCVRANAYCHSHVNCDKFGRNSFPSAPVPGPPSVGASGPPVIILPPTTAPECPTIPFPRYSHIFTCPPPPWYERIGKITQSYWCQACGASCGSTCESQIDDPYNAITCVIECAGRQRACLAFGGSWVF